MLIDQVQKNFEQFMDDDLNISLALATIFEFMQEINKLIDKDMITAKKGEEVIKLLKRFDKVLGIIGEEEKKKELSPEIEDLIIKREAYRKKKNWKKADEIRKKLRTKGIIIEDTSKGPQIRLSQNNN